MIAAWLLLLVPLSNQSPAWSLPHSMPVQQVSSAKTLSGDELLRIGEVHDHQHHFPETLTYYQLALSTFRENKQPRGVATALVKIAQVYERQGKIQDAYVALQEAVPIFARSSDRTAHARSSVGHGARLSSTWTRLMRLVRRSARRSPCSTVLKIDMDGTKRWFSWDC